VINIKKAVNALTISRIFGAVILLVLNTLGIMTPDMAVFYVVYFWCVLTDFIDGPIARRAKVTSNFGALLDSVADILLAVVVLIIFLPFLWADFQPWMVAMVAIVLSTRALAFAIGYKKHRTFTMLHTYSTKVAGTFLGLFPILLWVFGLPITITFLFIGAWLSALEELAITILSKELDRDVISVFRMKRQDS